MTTSTETKLKKLTKEFNQYKRLVNNLKLDVEAHSKALEGDFTRAAKLDKKTKKGSSKPVKRDVNTDNWFCCVTCKLGDRDTEKWKRKFHKPENKPAVRVFKGSNAKSNSGVHKQLSPKHTVKAFSVYLKPKK